MPSYGGKDTTIVISMFCTCYTCTSFENEQWSEGIFRHGLEFDSLESYSKVVDM